MNRLCIVCLIGIPASGKTTLSKGLKLLLESNEEYKFIVKLICFDDYEGLNNSDGDWKSKRGAVYDDIEKAIDLLKAGTLNINQNVIIILDDNMYYRSMRYEYVKLAKIKNIGFCQIYLDADLNSSLEFNLKRSNPVSVHIISNMFQKIEKPFPAKYIWESKSIVLKPYGDLKVSISSIMSLILSSLNEPLSLHVDETVLVKPCQTDIHIADIALRKLVTSKMHHATLSNANRNYLAKLSSVLSYEKRYLLAALKAGQLLIPENYVLENLSQEQRIDMLIEFFSSLLYLSH